MVAKPTAATQCFLRLCNSLIPPIWSVQPPSFKSKPTGTLHSWMIIGGLYNKSTWSSSEQVSARRTIRVRVMPENSASFYLLKQLGNRPVLAEKFTCTCMHGVGGWAGVCEPQLYSKQCSLSHLKAKKLWCSNFYNKGENVFWSWKPDPGISVWKEVFTIE